MDINQDQNKSTAGNERDEEAKEPKLEVLDDATDEQPTASAEDSKEQQENDFHAELKKAKAEADQFKDKYMRMVAEMDNLRKRTERERADLLKYGHEKVLEDILPVLDSFEKASAATEDSTMESFVEGVQMVFTQLKTILEKHGLKAFDSVGVEFDPNLHQAIQKIDDDSVDKETVKEEYQKGYQLAERLLRPAIVAVAVPSE